MILNSTQNKARKDEWRKKEYMGKEKLNKDGSLRPNHSDSCLNINEINTLYKKQRFFRLFKKTYRPFTKLDHILGHKTNLINFKRLKTYRVHYLTTELLN